MLIGTQVTYQLRPPLITRLTLTPISHFVSYLNPEVYPWGPYTGRTPRSSRFLPFTGWGYWSTVPGQGKVGRMNHCRQNQKNICPPPFLNPWLESNQRGAVFRPPALPIKLQGHIKPPDAVGGYEVGLPRSRPAEAGGGPQPVREEKRKNEKWQGLRPAYIISHT